MITTNINAGNLEDCDNNYAGGLISNIDDVDSIDCADILISDNKADELIASAINYESSTDCADNAAGGLIADMDYGNSRDCNYILTSYDEADKLIAADFGDSTDCDDTNASDDAVDGFMMLTD